LIIDFKGRQQIIHLESQKLLNHESIKFMLNTSVRKRLHNSYESAHAMVVTVNFNRLPIFITFCERLSEN